MWLNPQSWAVISGLATREQSELALESVHRELNTEYGVRLMFLHTESTHLTEH